MENPSLQMQQKAKKPEDLIRAKIMAAKSALGLKDLNVAAAVAGHKMYQAHASKNPNLPANQILNKISPNARSNYLRLTSEVPSSVLGDASMPQFRLALQKLKQARGIMQQVNNSFEITDLDQISEAARLKDEINPPYMLVLKRRGIRIFPDGKRVALYVNDKLGLTFTVPYEPAGTMAKDVLPGVQAEEIELSEENIDENIEHIKDIVDKHQAKKLKFQDGTSMNVDATTAKAIHLVHGALNDQNKAKVARMLSHSKGQFMKVADFAMKNTAFKIDK